MRLFFHHSFETRCSRRQISFFISLLQRNSLRNESVRSKHRSPLAAAGSVLQSDRSNVTWSCAYLHAAEGGGGGELSGPAISWFSGIPSSSSHGISPRFSSSVALMNVPPRGTLNASLHQSCPATSQPPCHASPQSAQQPRRAPGGKSLALCRSLFSCSHISFSFRVTNKVSKIKLGDVRQAVVKVIRFD